MDPKTNYTLVGSFVLVMIGAIIVASLWLSSDLSGHSYKTYLINISESVAGLAEQSAVKFNGVVVGRVKSIQISSKDPQVVQVLVDVDAHIPILTSTVATLKTQGITGLTFIGLSALSASGKIVSVEPGEPYPIIAYQPSFLFQLDKSAKKISDTVTNVASDVQDILNKENREALHITLESLKTITRTLANQSNAIERVIQSTSKAAQDFPVLANKVGQSLDSITKVGDRLSGTSAQVSQTMKAGRRVMRVFETQALPSAVSVLNKLDVLIDRIDQLTKELQMNPAIVVRGKKIRRLGPGE